ncbi:MAG TPA: ABC transporter substrate-binding protein [Acidimicrobiales bacterium]|nr:ABC transporter substrate-binding protein [Acidimicrobiales bacterium]
MGVGRLANLDPAQARSLDEQLVAEELFGRLTSYDPRTLEPTSGLASHWTYSLDQRQWSFFLRSDARFANGRAITATDVKYSLERVARRGSGSPGADLLEPVSGFGPFAVDGTAPELIGVTTPRPDVVHLLLDQPWSSLPSALASPLLSIVPRESAEAVSPSPPLGEAPVGSGPFAFARRTADTISLVRARGSSASLGGIDLVQFDTPQRQYEAFLRGGLDVAQVPADRVEEARQRFGSRGFRPYVAELMYGFNLKVKSLADPRLREAVARAIDRQSFVRAVYGGSARPTGDLIPTGIEGHDDAACGERCRYDPGRASALVGEMARAGRLPQVALDYVGDAFGDAASSALQASLGRVGIQVSLRPHPPGSPEAVMPGSQAELFELGWVPAYPSADAVLAPLFASGSPSNTTGFASAAVDSGLRQARAEVDAARRAAAYTAVERQILAQLPVVPLAQVELHEAVAGRVRGLRFTLTGAFDLSDTSVG